MTEVQRKKLNVDTTCSAMGVVTGVAMCGSVVAGVPWTVLMTLSAWMLVLSVVRVAVARWIWKDEPHENDL